MPSNSMGRAMKRTRSSSDITACPPLQPAQSCITFIAPGTLTPLNCASQSSCFLCVDGAEHAVKLHGKCDEAHTDLTRHRGMSPVTTSAELYHVYRTWESPRRCTSQRSAGASAMRDLDYIHPWNIAWSSFRCARGFIRPKY